MEPLPPYREKVSSLFGRCVLRLQRYELLMKQMLATQSLITVGPEMVPADPKLATSSLGLIAGRFFDTFVIVQGAVGQEAIEDRELEAKAHASVVMRTTVRLEMTREDHRAAKAAVLQLVDLRNTLVHHFVERFDIEGESGCADAVKFLTESCERIGRDVELLEEMAKSALETRRTTAAFLQTGVVQDFIVDGVAPDGVVDWPRAGIVAGLREALMVGKGSCDENGWFPLGAAIAFLEMHHPEQTPAKYGCRSWRQVLDVSKAFELKYTGSRGLPRIALFRERFRGC
jgi:hypothetical protein